MKIRFCMIVWSEVGLGSELEYFQKQFWEIPKIVSKIKTWKWECKPEICQDESKCIKNSHWIVKDTFSSELIEELAFAGRVKFVKIVKYGQWIINH